MIRAFAGIAVPPALHGMLTAAQAGLELGRPVPPENFHITLAFLGEHQEPVVEEAAHALAGVQAAAIKIEIAGLGIFGGDKPRILFAEVMPSAELSALRRQVRAAVRDAGIDLGHERFRPHVTLSRFGQRPTPDEVAHLQGHVARRMGLVRGCFMAEGFALFESHLGRNGPVYDPLVEYPLLG